MAASRSRSAVSLLCLVIALASLLGAVPAHAQIKLYTFSAYHTQDQMVYAPTNSLMLTAGISGASGWTVNSMQIVVDDVPYTVQNPSTGSMIYWNSSTAANPSEHTLYALAQISNGAQTLSLDSRNPPPPPSGPYSGSYGAGRASDFVIADVQLQSLKFNSSIPLTQDAVTPVPTPEFARNQGSFYPAAYIQGKNVNFTMRLCSSTGAALTGSATLGYALKLQATPNTTDPALTLFDNTTGVPVAPTAFSGDSVTVSATTALNSWVAKYAASFSPLSFYVEFTHVTPTPTWKQVATTNFGNTLYATVTNPTAPMVKPWVPVLDYACSWAVRTTNATDATTAHRRL